MGRFGCNFQGNLDDSKFSEPVHWIGIYVACASLVCLLAMATDAFHGFRLRKLWFPCRFFSLNSVSLTLVSIAIKLPMDLNTSMPRRQDQLAKLSSTILMCVVMANFMPSLGTMENKEIGMNVIALAILVITLVVNVCIQMGTGVIYVFQLEHAIIMFFMLVLLVILGVSALTVPTTKQFLEKYYRFKHRQTVVEGLDNNLACVVKKLTKAVRKYWMMAHTCSPQYVMGRSVTCVASGAFCLLSTLVLAETILRSYIMGESLKFCSGESDYKSSTILILVIQSFAVGVGTIAPACRWFNVINFRCHGREEGGLKNEFKVEKFWLQRLVEWKECPIALHIHGRLCRKNLHDTKNLILDSCIGIQTAIVLVSKSIQLASVLIVIHVNKFLYCCCKGSQRKRKSNGSVLNNDSGLESVHSMKLELSHFVLHLKGEEKLVEVIAKNSCEATDHFILKGRKKQPTYLIQLLDKSTMSQGFKGVREFDSDQVPSLCSEEPPNCWALPVVTLTSIAIALPNIDHNSIKWLLHGVSEGLRYVRLVENNLDAKDGLINIRKAASSAWLEIDLYNQWLDVDLQKLALEGKSPKQILEELAETGKNCVMEFKKSARSECGKRENPLEWPIKVLAANSMYRISRTILQDYNNSNQTVEKLFEQLSVTIADILGACLTNLPHFISMLCICSAIEEREKSVLKAAFLIGETEKILKTLGQQAVLDLNPDQITYIDTWRFMSKQDPLSLPSTASDNNV